MATSDLISREAAVREALRLYRRLEASMHAAASLGDEGGAAVYAAALAVARAQVQVLMELPEEDPRPRARWVLRVPPLAGGDAAPMCSACYRTSDAETAFCPWCGAKMEVDSDA